MESDKKTKIRLKVGGVYLTNDGKTIKIVEEDDLVYPGSIYRFYGHTLGTDKKYFYTWSVDGRRFRDPWPGDIIEETSWEEDSNES
jgi:hypothetical protein